IITTSAIRYAVCTQVISLAEAERPACISASDADTTWMSRIAMNMPNTIARKVKSLRGEILSSLTATSEDSWGRLILAAADSLMDHRLRGIISRRRAL